MGEGQTENSCHQSACACIYRCRELEWVPGRGVRSDVRSDVRSGVSGSGVVSGVVLFWVVCLFIIHIKHIDR